MTHIRNLPHILQFGITHRDSPNADPAYIAIGNGQIINKRSTYCKTAVNGEKVCIGDFIPFYFWYRMPMLYAIQMGHSLVPCKLEPEDIVCQRETLDLLLSILDTCRAIQRDRFLLYALYGYNYAEIGMLCGCSKVSAFESIEAVRKKFLKFFENHPNDWPR